MTYSPPSNKIQHIGAVLSFHERAVEVITELLAMASQRGFCLLAHPHQQRSISKCGDRLGLDQAVFEKSGKEVDSYNSSYHHEVSEEK